MIDELLNKYKSITETIIINLKNDISVDNLMEKRIQISEKIIKFDKEEIYNTKELYKTKGLIELDIKLRELLEKEMKKTKEDIKNLLKGKQANNIYNKNRNINNTFSTKI